MVRNKYFEKQCCTLIFWDLKISVKKRKLKNYNALKV